MNKGFSRCHGRQDWTTQWVKAARMLFGVVFDGSKITSDVGLLPYRVKGRLNRINPSYAVGG
jgi:hypothetical protein